MFYIIFIEDSISYIFRHPTVFAALIAVIGTFVTVFYGYKNTTLQRKKKEEAINFLNKKRDAAAEFLALCQNYSELDKKGKKKATEQKLELQKKYYFLKITYGSDNNNNCNEVTKSNKKIQDKIDVVYQRLFKEDEELLKLSEMFEENSFLVWEKDIKD
ncbi:hypothetical protein [Fructobacillus fructosus]|uniref:Uncharacterized protein n=1 Tax=Fructobacillus fructosus TaxID=1631 RepID=A0ABN9YTQ7_9LACO|nr:hypothetical protein [Fructobacillus fructosus]MBC9118612.1 hypothetical protein [Fructobacillus fructosus]MBD9365089.1 hypothetical protein [Leuconostoc mesenteroides]CAK1233021.1 unnamed protein product [Fructobacillus fructosus]CAK1244900.1 unnamed protein product [Fructobacillus fructosus]